MALSTLLFLLLIVWLALSLAWLTRQRRKAAETASWAPRTRALEGGGHVVEIVRRGEPVQEVTRIRGDLGWEELGSELADGMSEAEARAATLNAARAAAASPSAPRRRPR